VIIHYLANFFAGIFICNCIPHLVAGVMGQPFPTPFGKPRGVGDSSPLVNFLWGTLNGIIGIALLAYRPIVLQINLETASFITGFLLSGIWLAYRFGAVRKRKSGN
jgi:hypothetical protein